MNRVLLIIAVVLLPCSSLAADCRANIKAVTCRVAPVSAELRLDPRPCLGGEKKFVTALQQLHDEMPPKIQKMFCYLRKIHIEEQMDMSAYAGQNPDGNVIGLNRRLIFEKGYSLSEWLNRKDQMLFGHGMTDSLDNTFPQFDISYMGYKSDPLLIYVVLHEFGHLLERAHNFVQMVLPGDLECEEEANAARPECAPQYAGLWTSISWLPDGRIRPEDRYFGELVPCYYGCSERETIPKEHAHDFYRRFVDGNAFATPYASSDPAEDFAETFALYISESYLFRDEESEKYFFSSVAFPGEDSENLNSRANKGRMLAKMNFMAMFDAMEWKYENSERAQLVRTK